MLVFAVALVSTSWAESDFKTIGTVQLHSMVVDNAFRIEGGREQHFTIIDARTKEEYDEAHIFSAMSIPEKDVEKTIALLPKGKDVLLVVYGDDRKFETSSRWAGKAAVAGYMNVTIYAEGFSVWKKNKMPIAPFRSDF